MEKIMKKAFSPRNQKIILCFLVILISISFIRSTLTSTQTYKTVIQSIDEKRATVMQLVAASTAASAVITVIPDDVGTPIAQQLAELSKYFIIALSALYLEKYLLTIIGFISSTVLLPGASLLFFSYIMHPESEWKRKFAIKLLITSIIIVLIIPISIWASDSIEATYHDSIQKTISSAIQAEDALKEDENTDKSIWDSISEVAQSVIKGVSGAVEWAKTVLNNFIEAITIILVTNCLIPILVLLFFVWLIKQLVSLSDSILKDNPFLNQPTKKSIITLKNGD